MNANRMAKVTPRPARAVRPRQRPNAITASPVRDLGHDHAAGALTAGQFHGNGAAHRAR